MLKRFVYVGIPFFILLTSLFTGPYAWAEPIIQISPSSIEVQALTGDTGEGLVTITNLGTTELEFSIQANFPDLALNPKPPLIAVGGEDGPALLSLLEGEPLLASRYHFQLVDYVQDNLAGYLALIIDDGSAVMDIPKATALHVFFTSGRPVFLGMNGLEKWWQGLVMEQLAPVFSVGYPVSSTNHDIVAVDLNPTHPITRDLSYPSYPYSAGTVFHLLDSQWLMRRTYGQGTLITAFEGPSRSTLIGHSLTESWAEIPELQTNCVDWLLGLYLPKTQPGQGTIPPGQSRSVTLVVPATGYCDTQTAFDLDIASNDPIAPNTVIPINFQVNGAPNFLTETHSLNWGYVAQGGKREQFVEIRNVGCQLLTVAANIQGDGQFSVEPLSLAIEPNGLDTLVVTLEAAYQGEISASLSCLSNDPDTPSWALPLQTTVQPAPRIEAPPLDISVITTPGVIQTREIEIANSGDSDLLWVMNIFPPDQVALNQQAATAVLADLELADATKGTTRMALSPSTRVLLKERMWTYRQQIESLQGDLALKVIGVGGFSRYELLPMLLSDPVLTEMYVFLDTPYSGADLSGLDGLIVTEPQGGFDAAKAQILVDFSRSGRPVLMGIPDLFESWSEVSETGFPEAFGIQAAGDAFACTTPILVQNHPITDGLDSFIAPVNYCNTSEYFLAEAAQPLIYNGPNYHSLAVAGNIDGTSVLFGDKLNNYWDSNETFFHQAMAWLYASTCRFTFAPVSGSLIPGDRQTVTLRFDPADTCGITTTWDFFLASNDPLKPLINGHAIMDINGSFDMSISATEIDFGRVALSDTKMDTLSITTTGCDTLEIQNIVCEGGFQCNTGDTGLIKGDQLLLPVSFSPTSLGPFTGFLTFHTNDPEEPDVVIDLTGEGIQAPSITVEPTTFTVALDYNQTLSAPVIISNTGDGTLDWWARTANKIGGKTSATTGTIMIPNSLDMGMLLAGQGRVALQPPAGTIPPHSTAKAELIFDSTDMCTGTWLDTIVVFSNDPIDGSVSLTTEMQVTGFPDLYLSGDDLDLGLVQIGVSSSVSFLLENHGCEPLVITRISTDNNLFTVTPTDCVLQPGTSQEVVVEFTPTTLGSVHGTITIESLDPDSPTTTLVAMGEGLPSPKISISPTNFVLHPTSDTYESRTLTVLNSGNAVLNYEIEIDSLVPDGMVSLKTATRDSITPFQLEGQVINPEIDPPSGILQPGEQRDHILTFHAEGMCYTYYIFRMYVASNDPRYEKVPFRADMYVTGVPKLALADTIFNFPDTFIGTRSYVTLAVKNTGCETISITQQDFKGDLIFWEDRHSYNIIPGGTKEIKIQAQPLKEGLFRGTVRLGTSYAPCDTSLDLVCRGVRPPKITVNPLEIVVSLPPDTTTTIPLVLSNMGYGDLDWQVEVPPYSYIPDFDGTQANPVGSAKAKPLIGIGGYYQYFINEEINANEDLQSRYSFKKVLYETDDLSKLDGLLIDDIGTRFNTTRSSVIRAFHQSGRPILLSLQGLYALWEGEIAYDLKPVFGISNVWRSEPQQESFTLNTSHALTQWLTTFPADGWVGAVSAVEPKDADWLIQDPTTFDIFATASRNAARSLFVGTRIDEDWSANQDFYTNAIDWIMGNAGYLLVEPGAGTQGAHSTQDLQVTLNSSGLHPGMHEVKILFSSNDPLTPEIPVQVALDVQPGPRQENKAATGDFPGLQLSSSPNPFNANVVFSFNLATTTQAEIRIFDLRGRMVARIGGEPSQAGPCTLTWNGRGQSGRGSASGIYFYRLYLDNQQAGPTRKISLVR